MMKNRVAAHGKQLKLDGDHLADCRDEAAAEAIAIALNRISKNQLIPTGEHELVLRFF